MTRRMTQALTALAIVASATFAMAQSLDRRPASGCTTGGCSLNNQAGRGSLFNSAANDYRYPAGYSQPNAYQQQPAYNYAPQDYSIPTSSNPPANWRSNDPYQMDRDNAAGYRPTMQDPFQNRYHQGASEMDQGYSDYRSRLNNAVEDSFRAPIPNDYRSRGGDFGYQERQPLPPEDYRDTNYRGRLQDPFRLPSYDNFNPTRSQSAPLSRDYLGDSQTRSHFRMPLDRVDYSNPVREDFRNQRPTDWTPASGLQDPFRTAPGNDRFQDRPQPGYDPLTPPLPRRDDGNNEADAIYKGISARYGNPVNVRAVRSLSSTQALQLFREVNQQTDQRHLEPSSYDLRVRRGLRNLALALENEVFTQSVGISADSFRVDGFRTTLSRIAEQMRVANLQDATNVVQTVMQEAQNVPGLGPNVVAFEFANATVDTLDKFSALEPKEPGRGASLDLLKEENVRSAGLETEMVGVGVEIKTHESGLLIVKALREGPAAEAGLKSGDVITGINRRSIVGMSMANSVDLMKGNPGSAIQLSILRDGRSNNVTLVRRSIRLYTVNDAKILPGTDKVAYVSLSQFGPKSTEELDQALTQLHNGGMKSLVLDLRGNPGGLLNVCVDISNRFLPCGTIVSTKGRLSADNMLETATFNRTWSTPIVVLVDGDSASASEIFAAAIQDNQRGIVVGEKSYGKGTVQTHFPLTSINGNLRLTTARFYSPNGKAMSGSGVTPDVRITDADGPANGDRMLTEAVTIAQSQRLRDIAQAAKACRPRTGEVDQPTKSTFKTDIFDSIAPRTVLR